jgi:hypothetical protein
MLYQAGDGVPRNPDAAAAWYRDAGEGGLNAATKRLAALKQAIPKAVTPKRPGSPLIGVTLAFPARDATLAVTDGNRSTTLVWVAPPEPEPVQYVVQVREIGEADMQTVATEVVDETAVSVRLPSTHGFYSWSVDTIGRDGTHVISDWSWFMTNPSQAPSSSVASAPEIAPAGR